MITGKLVNQLTNKHLTIGLFGFGVVGKGLYDVLNSTPALNASIKKICVRSASKKRNIPATNFTTNAAALLNDDNINVIVELIDDADAAFEIVKTALEKGKAVVSANKKMIASHFEELLMLQREYHTAFLYEAACCASIPIIRNLEEYYDNDMLTAIKGIINGSTNYILTKIADENLSFKDALLLAQQLGFAESDPTLDIEGYDAVNKLTILSLHSFGALNQPADFIFHGIASITKQDSIYAKEKKLQLKLVAQAQRLANGNLAAFVLPQFVAADDDLYTVKNEFNALITESSFADKQFFKGKGAGAFPTAAAVLSDIAALRYGYKYEYKKLRTATDIHLSHDYYLKVYVGADDINNIRETEFEWIEEWRNEHHYNVAVGVLYAQKLFANHWWKAPGVSLILFNEPIIENIDHRYIRQKSLQLAGIA
ncbi:MAG: homoserine dehydrogenase [Ferruginibacter sp.]